MKISKNMSDNAVLAEIGNRIARLRLDHQFSQADLATQAGISKRTLERIEAGATTQISSLIRVLRAMNSLENLDNLIPPAYPRPMDLLKRKGKERKRASSRHLNVRKNKEWHWGENE